MAEYLFINEYRRHKSELVCWAKLDNGEVYRNRELTPYSEIPFIVIDPATWSELWCHISS